jgi:hypothetical protein
LDINRKKPGDLPRRSFNTLHKISAHGKIWQDSREPWENLGNMEISEENLNKTWEKIGKNMDT